MNHNETVTAYLLNRNLNMTQESIALFKSITQLKTFSKNDTIIDYGVVSPYCYIIKSGFIGSFIRHQDGSDFIRTIFKELNEIGALQCLIARQKSNATYKALTDCEVYELNYLEFLDYNIIDFKNLHIKILEKVYMDSEKRITELSALNATQRYLQLRNETPSIDNLLPQYQIANYLNVTPVQLSRIRRKLVKQPQD